MLEAVLVALEDVYLYTASVLALGLGQLLHTVVVSSFTLTKVSSKSKQLIYFRNKFTGDLQLISDAKIAARCLPDYNFYTYVSKYRTSYNP
jgi:hypothetical protein